MEVVIDMLFSKKKTVETIFTGHYKKMLQIAKTSSIAHNPEFELLPAMFVLTDYAAASARKDRRFVANEVIRSMKSLYKGFDNALLDKRCELYGEIIRGKDLRGEWFLGDISALSENAISKCTALLGDILYNPQCAENYDTAPVVVYGIFDSMKFADSVMRPLLDEMLNLFKEIYDL